MNSRPARGSVTSGEDVVAVAGLAALVLIAAGGAVVAAGAALAGLLRHGQLPPVDGAAVGHALVRLPHSLADPARAWPAAVARRLPGPLLYWAAQLAVVALMILVALAVVRRRRRSARGHPLRIRAYAGIGRGADATTLALRAPVPGRLSLGRASGRLLAAEAGASLAVIGPTGCGKTAGFAIPALLEWKGPVLATSVKADLLAATLAHRRRRGRVWVYDPTGAAGTGGSASWSPLGTCATWAGAMRTAAWLAEACQPKRDSVTDSDYWYGQARRALAPYLLAAAAHGYGMGAVVRWVDSEEIPAVSELLEMLVVPDDGGCALPGAEHAKLIAESLWEKEERLRGSVFSTMENVVAPFADPGVVAAGVTSDIDFEEWLAGDNTIYVVATSHEQARLRPVLTVLVQQAVRAAYDTATRRGGELEHPCLVLLDEAANISPLPDLPGYAATGRSHRISLVSIWQDMGQLKAQYGNLAQTVLNNHRAKLFGSGIADLATLQYLSMLIGDEQRIEHRRSFDVGSPRRTVSEHASFRHLAPVDLLRRVRSGEAVLLYGAELPLHVRLRPWYADKRLTHAAEVA